MSTVENIANYSASWQLAPAEINITNLRLRTFIGFNEEELSKQQDVIINARIFYQADQACTSDSEQSALNYKIITKAMITHVENNRFRLLEKLTADLLSLVMQEPAVMKASVRVDKPNALRFSDSVSLNLSASRKS